MGNHGSKGTLNKNSGKYSKKSGLSKKYKKRDFQNNSKYKHGNKFSKVKIPVIPNVSIRKEDVNDPGFFHLFRSLFECAILGICSKASLEDIHIIRVLAKLLWDFKDWVPNSNSKKKSPCIKLEPPEKILYDGLKELIKKQILSRCPDLFTKPHMWFLIFQTFNSVVFWMQKNGRIGYLNYIAEDLKNVSENLNKLLKGDFNTEIESLQDNFPKFLSNQY